MNSRRLKFHSAFCISFSVPALSSRFLEVHNFLFLSSLFLAMFSSLWLVFLACPAVGRIIRTTFQTTSPPIWHWFWHFSASKRQSKTSARVSLWLITSSLQWGPLVSRLLLFQPSGCAGVLPYVLLSAEPRKAEGLQRQNCARRLAEMSVSCTVMVVLCVYLAARSSWWYSIRRSVG